MSEFIPLRMRPVSPAHQETERSWLIVTSVFIDPTLDEGQRGELLGFAVRLMSGELESFIRESCNPSDFEWDCAHINILDAGEDGWTEVHLQHSLRELLVMVPPRHLMSLGVNFNVSTIEGSVGDRVIGAMGEPSDGTW